MQINRMRLVNYRNYADINLDFSPGVNIFYGNNGQGKTNLLEAIFLMNRGYSHRASSMKELIRFDQEAMYAASEFRSLGTSHRLALKAVNGKRGWKLDGSAESSFQKIKVDTGCIIFEPDDLEIVKAGPEVRRRFINWELSGLNRSYRSIYNEYERIRLQRNALIRQLRADSTGFNDARAMLAPWDEQLISAGSKIYSMREDYLRRLARKAESFHRDLSGLNEHLSLAYKSSVLKKGESYKDETELRTLYQAHLLESLEGDLERGYTRIGPHTDDLVILIDNRPARLYASQGQQRTAAISLKLAHIDLYKESTDLLPVVLLDDILSELDSTRQRNILSILHGAQTFITCTDPSFSSHLQDVTKFHINNGDALRIYE